MVAQQPLIKSHTTKSSWRCLFSQFQWDCMNIGFLRIFEGMVSRRCVPRIDLVILFTSFVFCWLSSTPTWSSPGLAITASSASTSTSHYWRRFGLPLLVLKIIADSSLTLMMSGTLVFYSLFWRLCWTNLIATATFDIVSTILRPILILSMQLPYLYLDNTIDNRYEIHIMV